MHHRIVLTFAILALGSVLVTGCRRPTAEASSKEPISPRAVAITVDDKGFHPSSITVARGESVALTFTRTSDDTCARAVSFPELKIERELPMNQPVAIDLPTSESRTLGFQCGMGMFKSTVVIQ